MSRASFLSPIASPIAQTCQEARRHRSQGMPSAGAAWAGPRRTENGPMQKPCAHPGTACVGTCPLPVAAQLLETASLRAACPGPCPDPTVHPGSGREAHTRPHSGGAWTLLPRPNGNGFWITRHVAGLSALLPPTIAVGGQEGPGLSLVFQDDLAES